LRLTTAALKTLALPAGVSDRTYFDDTLPGFGLRLRAGGAARWVVQYDVGQKTRRMTLGSVGALELGVARKSAKDILAAVRLGRDPANAKLEARARAGETFGTLLARYLPRKQAQVRLVTFKEIERHLVKYARPLHARPVAAIDLRAIATLMSAVVAKAGSGAANNMLASLSGYFDWLIREGLVEGVNPASLVNKAPRGKGRDRVLDDGEIREIWGALGDDDYADVVRLLFYTAARRSEIGNLAWNEVGLAAGEIRLPAPRTKNGREHIMPLSAPALAILQTRQPTGPYVFGGVAGFQSWHFHKSALDARIAAARGPAGVTVTMPTWTLHDIRRTFSTVAHGRLAIVPWVVEGCLGHVAAFKSGVSGVYNKSTWLDERRRALEKWATFIDEAVTSKRPAAKVVRLHRRK
jgi:integrase